MGKVRRVARSALEELIRPALAIWALCGGRERRRKRMEARIMDAILDNLTRNEPYLQETYKKKTPAAE